jgi:hypothetical protein
MPSCVCCVLCIVSNMIEWLYGSCGYAAGGYNTDIWLSCSVNTYIVTRQRPALVRDTYIVVHTHGCATGWPSWHNSWYRITDSGFLAVDIITYHMQLSCSILLWQYHHVVVHTCVPSTCLLRCTDSALHPSGHGAVQMSDHQFLPVTTLSSNRNVWQCLWFIHMNNQITKH